MHGWWRDVTQSVIFTGWFGGFTVMYLSKWICVTAVSQLYGSTFTPNHCHSQHYLDLLIQTDTVILQEHPHHHNNVIVANRTTPLFWCSSHRDAHVRTAADRLHSSRRGRHSQLPTSKLLTLSVLSFLSISSLLLRRLQASEWALMDWLTVANAEKLIYARVCTNVNTWLDARVVYKN